MHKIQTEAGAIYVSDAEHEQYELIKRIGWGSYCELMEIEPEPDPKARAARLRSLGFDWQTIAHCIGVATETLRRWLVEKPHSRTTRRETKRRYEKRKRQEYNSRWPTPSQIAREWNCHPETIRCAIREGRLEAVNISPGGERPTYRIDRATLPPAEQILRHGRKSTSQNGS